MKRSKFLSWLMVALFSLAATEAIAQEAQEPDDEVDFVMEAVSVTGSRIRGEAAESTAPVIILAKAQIQELGLASIGDVLQDPDRPIQRHQYPGQQRRRRFHTDQSSWTGIR